MALVESITWIPNRQPPTKENGGGMWRVSYYTEDGQHEYRFYSSTKVRDELEAFTRFMKEQTDEHF